MSAYATAADFDVHGIRPEARPAAITAEQISAAIVAASGKADSYLSARFRLPLSSWGVDLTQAVCAIAAFEMVSTLLLFQPDPATNVVLVGRKDDAIDWLKQVAAGKANPADLTDSDPPASSVARVHSKTPRGWDGL